MAIRTKDEILTQIKARIGDDSGDDAIGLIEDISDTLTDYEKRVSDKTDWQQKAKEIDDAWRQKYRDRFFSASHDDTDDTEDADDGPKKALTFDALFKTE